MLSMISSHIRPCQRVVDSRLINIVVRLSSTTSTQETSSKLTHSYYHHASSIPLLYHTVGQQLNFLAAQHPNHTCYAFKGEGNKCYTYKSFLDEVDSLATSLIDLGFEKNDRLAVWLPNTSENCALSYAASKIGVIKVRTNTIE
jgi:non-ribosomal peptide synthetase component E (peptide arylation enzyme)